MNFNSGPRGPGFKSPHSDHEKKQSTEWAAFFVVKAMDCGSGSLAEPSAAWFGKSGLPPPGADAGSLLLPQRSKNRRKSASPNGFSLTARRREAKRPGVQIPALRPRKKQSTEWAAFFVVKAKNYVTKKGCVIAFSELLYDLFTICWNYETESR